MTSANFFSGYTAEKPTSRVMNPPGGRTNNIFGGYEDEPVASPSHVRSKAQQENIRPISNIFAVPDDNSVNKPSRPDRMKSNIFGEDQTKATNNAQNAKKRTGINPITGRSYQEEEEEEEKRKKAEELQKQKAEEEAKAQEQTQAKQSVHTSSKVLQPPGGRSHKLW